MSISQISTKSKLFFLHIPKTAGGSMGDIIDPKFGLNDRLRPRQLAKIAFGLQEGSGCYIRTHVNYDLIIPLLSHKPICMTILRDPVDRFLSNFAHMQRSPETFKRLHGFDAPPELPELATMSLERFINESTLVQTANYQNFQTHLLAARFRFSTFDEFRHAFHTRHRIRPLEIELAKQRLADFDFVGLTERFQDSLFLLCYKLGWPPMITRIHKHKSPHRLNKTELSLKTVEKLHELNHLDLKLYEFAQQCFETEFKAMVQLLLEQYGQRSQAHLKEPLPAEELYQLLGKHYCQQFMKTHPILNKVDFDFSQAISGTGWYAPEKKKDQIGFRWTGPGPCSTLDFHLDTTNNLFIDLEIKAAITPEVRNTFQLAVNHYTIPLTFQKNSDKPDVFSGRLPRLALIDSQGFCRLEFKVDKTIAPCDIIPNNNDSRQLGLAFHRLRIYPKLPQLPTTERFHPASQLTTGNQLFYLHMPKAAGTTFGHVVRKQFEPDQICPMNSHNDLVQAAPGAVDQYRYLQGHLHYELVGLILRDDPVFITLLRDPIHRFISNYYYWQEKPEVITAQKTRVSQFVAMSLDEFAGAYDNPLLLQCQNKQTKLIATTLDATHPKQWQEHFAAEKNNLSLDLELAKKRLEQFAFVGLAEKFQESLFLLAFTFGWLPRRNNTYLNVTDNKPPLEEIPTDTLIKISHVNHLDIKLYHYAQRLFDKRYRQMNLDLLERYGTRRHARLEPPLSDDILIELLTLHHHKSR